MTIWKLATREVLHRKLEFGCALAAVAVAVGSLVAAQTLLQIHSLHTRELLASKEAKLADRVALMQKDVERAMERLGFNIVILPKDQDLGDWYADDYAAKTMPEEYLSKLRGADLITITHLVSRLRQRVKWLENKWTIILIGVGRAPEDASQTYSDSFVHSVPRGEIIFGHEIAAGLALRPRQTVQLLGRQFTIRTCLNERGSEEDVTVWINLADAQELLGKTGRINEIVALECRCAWADLDKIRKELGRVLPDTQVIEKASEALGAAQALTNVNKRGREAIEAERASRGELRRRRQRLSFTVGALAALVCACWLGLLVRANVRHRRREVGLWRTLGFTALQVAVLFAIRSFVLSISGGMAGFILGRLAGSLLGRQLEDVSISVPVFDVQTFAFALLWACLVTGLAAIAPTLVASRQDPALILREDM